VSYCHPVSSDVYTTLRVTDVIAANEVTTVTQGRAHHPTVNRVLAH